MPIPTKELMDLIDSKLTKGLVEKDGAPLRPCTHPPRERCNCCWLWEDDQCQVFYPGWGRMLLVRSVIAFRIEPRQQCKNPRCVRPQHQLGGQYTKEFYPEYRLRLDRLIGQCLDGVKMEW